MTKTQRAKTIRDLLDELRKDIVVKNEMQMFSLELLKRKENNAIDENTDEAVEKVREFVEMKKLNKKIYPALRLKSEWVEGKFTVTKI